MLVSDHFEREHIEKSTVELQAEVNEYWAKASSFVIDNWDRDLEDLTPKQARWMEEIWGDLVERRIEGRL